MAWRVANALETTEQQQGILLRWVSARKTPQKVVFRARIVLLAATGMSNNRIAQELETSRPTVLLWRHRFQQGGHEALLHDAAGRGRKPVISAAQEKKIVDATLQTKPAAATHWSTRSMAAVQGVSSATVQRIWKAHGLQAHRTRTFKLSRDKRFVEKLTDVVGLYLNPPEKAIVLCVDEKSQIQALNRTQPGLPMKRGRCGTMTHDYERNGTTTLFAALNVLEGKILGECMPRHRHQEFLKFLKRLDREFPAPQQLHLIMDNSGTHTKDKVDEWLLKPLRFHFHFTPTSSSWLNLVERWFAELTEKRIRRGSFRSVNELTAAIEEFIQQNNLQPKPFVWTASVDDILQKVNKCKAISETVH